MAATADEYLDTHMDADDVFPCKGCGEILEEGKAYELSGSRWHLDCFRCHTCGTLLDSDANLLLLGDGSLICNNCTYSCNACGNKIEDLAILTGEQAFCETCFRCRNCKRKIENLRYARTSQGIFCMGCHETIMARRKKKSKAAAAAKLREKDLSPMMVEKSLPALPPNALPTNTFPNDRVDPDSDTPTEISPRPRPIHRQTESSSRASSRPSRSSERDALSKSDGLSLPASTYRKNRNSSMLMSTEAGHGDSPESFFIPVALDPSPGPHGTRSTAETPGEAPRRKKDDYFGASRPMNSDKRSDAHVSAPHIAFQGKGRPPSTSQNGGQTKSLSRKLSKSSEHDATRSSASGSDFKLQDAPSAKRNLASRSSSSHSSAAQEGNPTKKMNGVTRSDGPPPILSELRRAKENSPPPRMSQDSRWQDEDDFSSSHDSTTRGTSKLDKPKGLARKELPSSSVSRAASKESRELQATEMTPTADHKESASDTYMHPRAAPVPPSGQGQATKEQQPGSKEESTSPKVSPKLPRWSSGGDFSLDEDMARILGTDEGSSSILRRVSNVVRHGRTGSVETGQHPQRIGHGRSISETTRVTVSPRWPKSSLGEDHVGHPDISSPVSLTSADDPALLKRQLRYSEQRVAELERQFNSEKDLMNLNKRLLEKRKTVSVLDTQTEVMIRQLEVLAGYVERAKETKTPIDPRELEDSAIKEFVQKLERVKMVMSASIELLHEERDQLVDEKNQALADRDRTLMEFEQLSSKNAQLAEMNNDLTHQIQERFKSQIGTEVKSPNGLGIYGQKQIGGGSSSNIDTASMTTGTTLIPDEDTIVEAGPTVVQVRKGQVKKFNWKKGSKTMAQNVAKGVNRAVVAFQQTDRERMQHQGLIGDNIGLPYNMTVSQVESPAPIGPNNMAMASMGSSMGTGPGLGKQQLDPGRQGFGFFGKKNAMPKSTSANTVSASTAAELASTLFGSELSERAEFERRQIPTVVTRCIEEVELRGMDQEGIYRKTGGNSQVNMIKDGFDKSDTFDISDPDYDITAITSVLKQYFRRLPTPLLTFDVYERVLESNAIADEAERCDHLRRTFLSMPPRHSDCLEFLIFHLSRVAQREPENLMSPKNLAVVFAPTIMRDLSIEREMTDMHAKNIAVQFVIENSHRIFDDA